MKVPGFTAEASLYSARRQYQVRQIAALSDRVVAAFPWDPPQLTSVSYQSPSGPGFPGTLTVKGQNFTPDADILLTIYNCDAYPLRSSVHTTKSFDLCWPPLHPRYCNRYFGGEFTTSVSCFCGGRASVESLDLQSGDTATGGTNLPC